jgi:3-hydroxybutyrate dehydrogenase
MSWPDTGAMGGNVAAITGGTRGIGRGIAEGFLSSGARVALFGRSHDKGRLCLTELQAGERASFVSGDATRREDVETFIDASVKQHGRLDVVVLNAGAPIPARLVDVTNEDFDYQMRLNFNQVFWGMRRALRHMIPQGSGRIICISSVEGKTAKASLSIYTACKHAVHGLVKSTAREVGQHGITVNAICPGPTMTDAVAEIGPKIAAEWGIAAPEDLFETWFQESAIKRPNTVQEIAAVAVLLSGESGAGITGSFFNVDGGISPY